MRSQQRNWIFFLIAALLFISHIIPAGGVTGEPSMDTLKSSDMKTLSKEFHRLRNIKGHFQGGQWNDDVDRWNGLKHRVMMTLATKLSEKTISELMQWMGEPDRIVVRKDPDFQTLISKRKSALSKYQTEKLLIYHWRGDRDYLYFACGMETVLYSGWWYSGE